MKNKYVVFRNEGQGGMWLYLIAHSVRDIEQRFPEFYVFETPPKRFSLAASQVAEHFTFDIDNPEGWLKSYIEHDQELNFIYQNPSHKPPFIDD